MTINAWYRYELNSSTYTAIDEIVERGYTDVLYYIEDGTSCYIANDSDGINAYKLPGGSGISETIYIPNNGIAFYAKAEVGTPTLTIKTGVLKK